MVLNDNGINSSMASCLESGKLFIVDSPAFFFFYMVELINGDWMRLMRLCCAIIDINGEMAEEMCWCLSFHWELMDN